MKREDVIKQGIKIDEVDFNNNGIYAGTYEFYLVGDALYSIATYDNSLSYNGKNETMQVLTLEEKHLLSFDYVCIQCGMSEEGFAKLEELLN